MPDLKLIPLRHQPFEDVLFINAAASAEHLFEAAARRLQALEELLNVLANHDGSESLLEETARLAWALAPLASEARQLYEVAQQAQMRISA